MACKKHLIQYEATGPTVQLIVASACQQGPQGLMIGRPADRGSTVQPKRQSPEMRLFKIT
jgi:hypothetical protein